jgi:GNAT superfamily N-acetyltransferase
VSIRLAVRDDVDDAAVSHLHALAFGADFELLPWRRRLSRHSLTWVTACDGDQLVGFANVVWDGGAHAFLLDVVVHPDRQRAGLGTALVRKAAQEAAAAGCAWLHVDFEHRLSRFYLDRCGFRPTAAGLLDLVNRTA